MDRDNIQATNNTQTPDGVTADTGGLAPGLDTTPGLGTGASDMASLDDITASDTMSPGSSGALGGLSGVGSMGSSDLDSPHPLGGSVGLGAAGAMGDNTTSGMNSSSAGGSGNAG